MDKSIYGFIWRYSSRQQLMITLITMASFPLLYASLELPKIIVNDALKGDGETFPFFCESSGFPRVCLGIEFDQATYLLTLCTVLFLLILANVFFLMTTNTYKNLMSERMTRRLRFMLYQRILRFPLPHFQRVSQGELSTMIAGEVELVRDFMADAIALPVYQGGTLLVILSFMFAQNWLMGVACIALIPLQAYVVPKLQRKVNLYNRDRIARARKLSGRVGETVSGIRDIHANNTEVFSQADFSWHLDGIFKVRYKYFSVKYFMKALNVFLLKLTPLLFYSVGGLLIINGQLDVGQLVAALGAYSQLTTPWKELLRYYQRVGDTGLKYQQLVDNFELGSLSNPEILDSDTSDPGAIDGSIKFDKLTVSDEDGSKPLDSVSLEVPSAGRMAIVAGDIGRDRFAQTLMRLTQPSSGQIAIGGRDLSSLPEKLIGTRIGYAGAETHIFEGTFGYNSIYGLLREIPVQVGDYDAAEAAASGNSPYDVEQDWTDLSSAGVSSIEQLQDWWFQVIHAIELDETVLLHALNARVDETKTPGLPEKLLEARGRIVTRLESDDKLSQLVRRYDFDSYNVSAAVSTNLMFGRPMDDRLAPENFGTNAYVRSVLAETGLDKNFQEIGFDVAANLVEIFGDDEAEAGLLERFSFVDSATIARLAAILAKAEGGGLATLDNNDRAELISLTSRISIERHRLGHIDEEFQARVVEARKLFHDNLPEDLADAIAFYDPEKFNPQLSIRQNLIMGRNNQQRANAESKINELLREVIEELDLLKDVIIAGMDTEVGIGGQRLTTAARQGLALARSIIKRPAILIINNALGAYDRETVDRIRQNIFRLLPETTFIWLDSEMPKADDFNEVLVLRDGRIDKRIVEAREQVLEPVEVEAEVETETPMAIDAEAAALAKVPMFRDIRSSNLKLLAFGSKRVTFEEGEMLFRQGDQGNSAYVIFSGEVDILLDDGTPDEKQVARLGRHEPVGEIALLATVPRTAGARAYSKVVALEIEKEPFLQIVQNDPKVAANAARIASERLANTMTRQQKAA